MVLGFREYICIVTCNETNQPVFDSQRDHRKDEQQQYGQQEPGDGLDLVDLASN
jgi:hypothetical protein